jgi:hypothetical protein
MDLAIEQVLRLIIDSAKPPPALLKAHLRRQKPKRQILNAHKLVSHEIRCHAADL